MSRKATTKPSLSSSTKTPKNSKKPLKTVNLAQPDSHDEPPTKKFRAGFTLSNPPIFDLTKDDVVMPSSSQGSASSRSSKPVIPPSQRPLLDIKGKNKETRSSVSDEDDRLWVDKYEPKSEAELAVHKRKVEDVRHWLLEAFEGGPSAKLRKYRRILALTGPAGTAKTATLRVLSQELNFEILEWRNSMNERGPSSFADDDEEPRFDNETLSDKFQTFLTRAMTCNSIFGSTPTSRKSPLGSFIPSQSTSVPLPRKRQLVLLEDLPNLLHQPTQARFQAALRSLCISIPNSSDIPGPPIVVIVSDSGLRAEQPDDDTWDGGTSGRRWDKREVLDIRNVLGHELLSSPYVTCIGFNPIAPTLMTKALQALLSTHFGSSESHGKQPSREVIDIIVESSNGDIRSAIMALQFACIVDLPGASKKIKGKGVRKNASGSNSGVKNVRAVLEAVTRREQSLVLFHLMGKILYNKRKFDPPASHLSAKEAAKEREMDVQLKDPPPLPPWLSHHNRKASRVCIETIAAESPIDSGLLGLYTHQNYTQFCTDIDQCDGICEGLSWVDSMGGTQMTTTPYAFPTLALSTLHALPTPVPRRQQKVCKPVWFEVRTRQCEAVDAVGDVIGWLGRGIGGGGDVNGLAEDGEAASMSVGRWTHASVATELGGWLRALDRCSTTGSDTVHHTLNGHRRHAVPPSTHRLFSSLPWSVNHGSGAVGDVLGERDDGGVGGDGDGAGGEEEDVRLPSGMKGEDGRGWLEEDDIEEVE